MKIRSFALAGLLWGGAAAALAQDANGDAAAGQALFVSQCAYCHGLAASGDGPLAGALIIKPRDLTGLAAANDGVFPVARTVARIDGRQPLVSHGSPMPVFGSYFEGDPVMLRAETGQPIRASQPIADLVAYLETLQK